MPTGEEQSSQPSASAEGEHIGTRVRRSLAISFVDRYLRLIINIGSAAILARLLTPEDYGVYTVGIVVVTLAEALRDFGVETYLIQEKQLTDAAVRTAYGVALLMGAVMSAAMFLLSGPISRFYADDGVYRVLLVLAVNFLVTPVGSTVIVLLTRELKFAALAGINLASLSVNMTVAIALAFVGFRNMSLAWGTLAGTITVCAVSAVLRPRQFSLRPSLSEWRRIMSFGVIATAGILVSQIGSQWPSLIIGRLLGVSELGIYGRAEGLVNMFNRVLLQVASPVALSAFALRHRSGIKLRDDVLGVVGFVTGFSWPFYCFVALMAFPIIRILFGDGWDEAIPIARILCFAFIVRSLGNMNWNVFQATGEMRLNLSTQLIIQPTNAILIILAAQFNLIAVAIAVVLTSCFSIGISYHFINRIIGTSPRLLVRATYKSAIVSAATLAIPALVLGTLPIDGNHLWIPFAVAAIGGGGGWLLAVRLCAHPIGAEIGIALASARRWIPVVAQRAFYK